MFIDESDLFKDINVEEAESDSVKVNIIANFEISFNRKVEISSFRFEGIEYLKITKISKRRSKSFNIEKKYLTQLIEALQKAN